MNRTVSRSLLALGLVGLIWGVASLVSIIRFDRGLEWVRREVGAGRFVDARTWLRSLSPARLHDPEAAFWLGVCEHAQGDYERALAAWSRVPAGSLKSPWAELSRARTLVTDLGRFSEAERLLEKLVERPGPARDEARRTLAQLYFYEGRDDATRRLIQMGWRQSPSRASELRNLWMLDSAPPRVETVRDTVDRATRLAGDDDRVLLARANLATRCGQFVQAGRDLDACLQKRPDDPLVWQCRLEWARAAENHLEATKALAHVPADALSEEQTLALKAWLASGRGDLVEERQVLEQLVKRSPGAADAIDRLAAIAWKAGLAEHAAELRRRKAKVDQTIERYRSLLKGTVADSSYAELATLAEELGRWFEAEGWWELALSREPSNQRLRDSLERVHGWSISQPRSSGRTLADVLIAAAPVGGPRPVVSPPGVSASPPNIRLVDDADAAGLQFRFENGQSPERQLPETMSGGVGLIDYDNDGWLDVYAVQGGAFPPEAGADLANQPGSQPSGDRLFRNQGDGTFKDMSDLAGIAGRRGYGHGVAVGDYDNDGHADLFVTRWRAYTLYRNRGDGTFENVTDRSGLGGDRDWPTSAAFADLDNDGDLDLYVCHYLRWDAKHPVVCGRTAGTSPETGPAKLPGYCMPHLFASMPDHLFRNDGGRFIDVTDHAGIVDHDGRGLGVVAADFDDDGLVDLFVSNDATANFLFRNIGNFRFQEVGAASGVACNAHGAYQAGMGVAVGDFAGQGRLDLAVTNFYGESTTYFRNLGRGVFADETAAIGLAAPSRFLLGFGAAFLDVNNDRHLDLMTANGHVSDERPDFPYAMPAQLFMGGADGRVTEASGVGVRSLQVPRVARGLAVGDLDNDGRTDVVLVAQNGPLVFLHNQTEAGHFVTFFLEGKPSNRDAVGARVTVTSAGKRSLAHRVGGGSYLSASDPRLAFGLGAGKEIDKVEVRWPSGRLQTFVGLKADAGYRLREGDPAATRLPGFGQSTAKRTGRAGIKGNTVE